MGVAYVSVLRHLKEELVWALGKWYRLIIVLYCCATKELNAGGSYQSWSGQANGNYVHISVKRTTTKFIQLVVIEKMVSTAAINIIILMQ